MIGGPNIKGALARVGELAKRAISIQRLRLLFAPVGLLWTFAVLPAGGATFTVVNTNDSGDGSLRWAISNANYTVGMDLVGFNIPESGPHTIRITTPLPTITDPVTIDGYTQPGASPNTLPDGNNAAIRIRLDGTLAGNATAGLQLNTGNSAVRGLCIVNFGGNSPSAHGISLNGQSTVQIDGNYIGIDVDGVTVQGNAGAGIRVSAPDNIIGGATPDKRNVISGNKSGGIQIVSSARNKVLGNYIGTDASGTLARGNVGAGVTILNSASTSNVIGGTLAGARNVISGNGVGGTDRHGILISRANGNRIERNYIGTDTTGTVALPNAEHGVAIRNASINNIVGGSALGTGNVISGNGGSGVALLGASGSEIISGTKIQGNLIGTDRTGVVALGNASAGVSVTKGEDSFIGGDTTDQGNVIAHNGGAGVAVISGNRNLVRRNSLFSNGGLGIDLGVTGVDPNDFGDGDTGANDLQNYPVLSNVHSSGGTTTIQGMLSSVSSGNNHQYQIDFYSSPDCDSSLHGEGRTYLGFLVMVTPANGATNFTAVLSATVPIGHYVTATATDVNNNTSEFSLCRRFVPDAPVILGQPQNQSVSTGSTVVLSVAATGNPSPDYQWRLNGVVIPGATNSSYTIPGFQATNGGSYTVVLANDWGVTVSRQALVIATNLPSLSVADIFANRPLVAGLQPVTLGSNTNATRELGEPRHSGIMGGRSVWFSWTAPVSGIATFSTRGSDFDTLIGVYTGSSLGALTEVAGDDDSGGFETSRAQFSVVGGTTYQIAVDGRHGAMGHVVLSWSLEVTLDQLPRIAAHPVSLSVESGGSAHFAVSTTGGGHSYQWMLNGSLIPGATNATLDLLNVQPSDVGVYGVRVRAGAREIISRPASLQINTMGGGSDPGVVARNKYFDLVEIVRAAIGEPETVQAASSGGGPARGYTGTQVFSTYGGSSQSGEPVHCGVPGGSSSWVAYIAESDGMLEINTDGSNFDTVLAVYIGSGDDFESLDPMACDNDSGANGKTSKAVFPASGGTLYWIAVDGVNGAWGTVVLNYNLTAAPVVTQHPASLTVPPGATVTLTAAGQGNPPPACQWQYNQSDISGATNVALTITNFQSGEEGVYRVVMINSIGVAVSSDAVLLLNSPLRLDSFERNEAGQLQLRLIGQTNTTHFIQASINMVNWTTIATNLSVSGIWNFTDAQLTNFPQRFYRAVRNP